MPLKPENKSKFAEKAELPRAPFEAVLTLPYDGEAGILDIAVSQIRNIIYYHKSGKERKAHGLNDAEIMQISVYFDKGSYTYFDMDPRLMRAMYRKAREGHDVDFRIFYDVFPEENPEKQNTQSAFGPGMRTPC
jgi:hypothetical protein